MAPPWRRHSAVGTNSNSGGVKSEQLGVRLGLLAILSAIYVLRGNRQAALLHESSLLSTKAILRDALNLPSLRSYHRSGLLSAVLPAQHSSTTSLSSSSSCPLNNTGQWLEGPRLSNVVEERHEQGTATVTMGPIDSGIGGAPPLLDEHSLQSIIDEQRICHPEGVFRNLGLPDDENDEDEVHVWKMRLLYAAIYRHQTRHARGEAAMRRRSTKCTDDLHAHKVGSADYECVGGRFLVVSQASIGGLGSIYNVNTMNVMLVGLAMNRTVVFANDLGHLSSSRVDSKPWILTCNENNFTRRDSQCFFRPITPCAFSISDINTTGVEVGRWMRKMEWPDVKADERILVWSFTTADSWPVSNSTVQVLHNIALELIDELGPSHQWRRILMDAAETILDDIDRGAGLGDQFLANSPVRTALLLYMLRPRPKIGDELRLRVQESLRQSFGGRDANAEPNLGVMIRGSDKCNRESECMAFGQYMEALSVLWTKNSDSFPQAINQRAQLRVLLSSESTAVFESKDKWIKHGRDKSLPFDVEFVSLNASIGAMPETGKYERAQKAYGRDLFDVVYSAMSTLYFQLHSTAMLGNGCSHFHNLALHFIRAGCGAASSNTRGQLLQELGDPRYYLCCEKKQNPKCIRERNAQIAERFGNVTTYFDGKE